MDYDPSAFSCNYAHHVQDEPSSADAAVSQRVLRVLPLRLVDVMAGRSYMISTLKSDVTFYFKW